MSTTTVLRQEERKLKKTRSFDNCCFCLFVAFFAQFSFSADIVFAEDKRAQFYLLQTKGSS